MILLSYAKSIEMVLKKYVYSLFAFVLITSCSTGNLWRSSLSKDEIQRLDYLKPVSFINYIEKGNKAQFNDSLSALSETLVETVVWSKRDNIPLNNKINTLYEDDRLFIENELSAIVDALEYGGANFYELHLSQDLLDFMRENNSRYLLGVVSNGLTRRPGNYTGQIFKSIGIAILTFGMYYPVPIKSSSNMYVMILDAEKENLAFYRRSILQDQSPLDAAVIEKQIYKIFKGYFYEK